MQALVRRTLICVATSTNQLAPTDFLNNFTIFLLKTLRLSLCAGTRQVHPAPDSEPASQPAILGKFVVDVAAATDTPKYLPP